jgi:cell division protein FtsQ
MKRPEGFDGPAQSTRKPKPERAPKAEKVAKRSIGGTGQAAHRFRGVKPKVSPSIEHGTHRGDGDRQSAAETQKPQATQAPQVSQLPTAPETEASAAEPFTEPRDSNATADATSVLVAADFGGMTPATPEVTAARSGVRGARAELKRAERERRLRERVERKRFTAHFRSQRRRWVIGVSAVLGLALFVAAGVFTPIMAVREIRVEGAETVNVEELNTALARFEGVPLALVNDQDVHRAIETFPLIQRYAIERIPPHTLVIRIEEREPVIALERGEKFDLIDPAGVLLARVDERPVGVPLGSAELTDTSSPAFSAVATVIRDLPQELREQLIAARATSAQDVVLTLASGTEVIWGDSSEIQRKATVLQALLAAVGQPTMIDVSAPDAPIFK